MQNNEIQDTIFVDQALSWLISQRFLASSAFPTGGVDLTRQER